MKFELLSFKTVYFLKKLLLLDFYLNKMTGYYVQDPQKQAEQLRSNDTKRFHIELLFSPGLYPCFQTEKERIYQGTIG